MEVVAPGGLTPAPFALSPRHNLLAVGMASSAAARADAAEKGATRVDVLRLLQTSGEYDLGRTLQVECVLRLRASGLRRIAWSSTPTNLDGDDDGERSRVEELLYPSGLLAGGFEDGAVRIWTPDPALSCDIKKLPVPEKARPVLILNPDPEIAKDEEASFSNGTKDMYSSIKDISWKEDREICQRNDEDDLDKWHIIEHDAENLGWDLINNVKHVDYLEAKQMQLVTETHELNGPVLGLSFSDLVPQWLATAALSDRIFVHDLHYPIRLSSKKHEFTEVGSIDKNSQITCLKWSKISPCILASSGDAGVTKIWDLRFKYAWQYQTTFNPHDKMSSSDLEFSWNNPMHLAVSSSSSATVMIWDIRNVSRSFHKYEGGESNVVSLSWNRSGLLLASDSNGGIRCYDVYKDKVVQGLDLAHCDIGLTWTHSETVAATISSKTGVKLCEIGG